MERRVEAGLTLVTGATGFIGRHVTAAARSAGIPTRTTSRSRGTSPDTLPPEHRVADLRAPDQVSGLCRGVDSIIHCASAIGCDPATAWATNEQGTRTLLAEAQREGVVNVVYLSTAAVYQEGTHRGQAEGQLPTAPGSETSKSRLAAEQLVLAHGGAVVRPHLVVGSGDQWVIPGALAAQALLAPAQPTARHTIIEVSDLARLLVALTQTGTPGVFHAGYPTPVTFESLLRCVPQLAAPHHLPSPASRPGVVRNTNSQRLRSLALQDHYYDCHKIWFTTGLSPRHESRPITPSAAGWYRRLFTTRGDTS